MFGVTGKSNLPVLGLTALSLVVSLVVGGQFEAEASAHPGEGGDAQTIVGEDAEAFEAQDSPVLVAVFSTCDFELEGWVDPAKACGGTVALDNKVLRCESDWKVTDPTTLRFLGSSCEQLTDGERHAVQATFPCDDDDPRRAR